MMNRFATVVNCMDGRVQRPVQEFIKQNYGVDFVDTITLPGACKVLAEYVEQEVLNFVKKCLNISIDKHGSRLIAVVGHYDCAGNPVDRETQRNQIADAVELVKNWFSDVQVIGLWVNDKWQVEKLI